MPVHSKSILVLIVVLVALILCVCNDEKVTSPQRSPDTGIAVSGQVYMYYCGIKDPFNNPYNGDFRYSAWAGSTARVTFVDTVTLLPAVAVCGSNGFSLRVDSGAYLIIVETGYTHPDTFAAVDINRPDTLELDIVAEWEPADSLILSLSYSPVADTIGEARERELLDSLAALLGSGMIVQDDAVRRVSMWHDSSITTIYYYIPVDSDTETWAVVDRALELQSQCRAVFPARFVSFYPGYYACLLGSPGGATAR